MRLGDGGGIAFVLGSLGLRLVSLQPLPLVFEELEGDLGGLGGREGPAFQTCG